ncbi:MAG: anhydro-N-acetylmuramic acid kinase [Rhizobacter sp.]|nr:anhydro-N-acetylmuramic acid kinase [Rhizobacter sp.]
MTELYIGLMSGTSLDGVDGVLLDLSPGCTQTLSVLAHVHRPLAAELAGELLALNTPGDNELHRAALAGNALTRVYAEVVHALLATSGANAGQVLAIGAHGQTVRHRPGEFDGTGYTMQLGNPALLAELTGIDVVADLRSRDVAAGGQGAPLVPAFHRAVFGRKGEAVGVLNIGGMANLTALHANGSTSGFDCGPGNALMDHWSRENIYQAFDADGAWAASGTVVEPLLVAMLGEPFFGLPPPKSTGRDLFHPAWLNRYLQANCVLRPQDVQATLAELTARSCAFAVQQYAATAAELLVCGGGALNHHLMARLKAMLPTMNVVPSDARGLPAMQVEASAFAWLARAFCRHECASLSAVTGAVGPRRLGALYPA